MKELLTKLEKYNKEIELQSSYNHSLSTINADIKRTNFIFSRLKSDKIKIIVYKNILFEVFKHTSLEYIQGMSEIASVFVELFFYEKVDALKFVVDEEESIDEGDVINRDNDRRHDENETKNKDISRLRSKDGHPSTLRTLYIDEEDSTMPDNFYNLKNSENNRVLKEFLNSNSVEIAKTQRIFCNFILDKLTPLTSNNFSLYIDYNKVFIKIMKKRGIKIDKNVSLKYMNFLLTFFTREFSTPEAIFEIYNIIVLSDCSVLFSMLVVLFGHLKTQDLTNLNNRSMDKLPDNFMEDIKNAHVEFKAVYEAGDEDYDPWSFLVVGAAASVIAAVGVALYSRNKK